MSKKRNVPRNEITSQMLLSDIWGVAVWITGILVSLAVAFGMVDRSLRIPLLSDISDGIIIVTAGWIVVILTILSVILRLFDKSYLELSN